MTLQRRYNVTTGMLLGLLGVPALLFSLPQLNAVREGSQQASLLAAPYEAERQAVNRKIQQAQKSSSLPLQLMRTASCVLVVRVETGGDPVFVEGLEAFYESPNGQNMPPGTQICNKQGQSATVGVDGRITSVAYTPVKNMPEYRELYEQRIKLQNLEQPIN